MLKPEDVRAKIEAYVSGWRTADRSAWLSLFADNAVFTDPVGKPPFEGKEAIAAFWDKTHSMGMTLSPEVQRIVVCGNEGVLLFRMTALGPDGTGMSLDVCDVFSLDASGKIAQLRAFWDKGCMLRIPADSLGR
jgi:steroid delta-isomerase